jgi:DNA-binding response OmpR family regulator
LTARILVVEDQRDLAFGIQRNLEFDGYRVDLAHDGVRALELGLALDHDLIILDLMLPTLDGMSVLAALRTDGIDTPVLILSARGEERDKVKGLRSGADDYLTKPFGIGELLARVEALLRRAGNGRGAGGASPRRVSADDFQFGEVEVDLRARLVRRNAAEVALTPREFDLLVALLRSGGAACSRHDLLRDVWGHKAEVETRTVDTHIGELRRKLEDDPARPLHILTVRKFGYRLEPDPSG